MRLCGLHWDTYDQILDLVDDKSTEAFGRACERLGTELSSVAPETSGKLYHFGQFQEVVDIARKKRLQAMARDSFWSVVASAQTNLSVRKLEVANGDHSLPAILVESNAATPDAETLVLINGLDSVKEVELWAFATRFLNAGIDRCVLLDGPGQGEALIERSITLNQFESAVQSVFQALHKNGRPIPCVKLFGVSFGGFLAMQTAQLLDCVSAVVCFSCAEEWSHLARLPKRFTQMFQFAAGTPDQSSWKQAQEKQLRLLEKPPKCPVLITHGSRDVVMPIDASRRLATRYDQVTLLELDDGHVFLHHIEEMIKRSAKWLNER
jgi:pimeloyl-ACP methyl ester carboxylesterase